MSVSCWSWLCVKHALVGELDALVECCHVLSKQRVEDLGETIIFVVRFHTHFLTRDKSRRLFLAGPVDVQVKYKVEFLDRAPARGELALLTSPARPFHPNMSPAGTICAWQEITRPSLRSILINMWDAVRSDWSSLNLDEGQTLNPVAADFYQLNRSLLPLDDRPLFEAHALDGPPVIPIAKDHRNWTFL